MAKYRILQSLTNHFVQRTIIVCSIIIVTLILTLCVKIEFKSENTYYYFLNTISQTYGGILAILMALLIFRINNTDSIFNNLTDIIIKTISSKNVKFMNPLKIEEIYNNLNTFGLNQSETDLLNSIKDTYKNVIKYREYVISTSYFVIILLGVILFLSVISLISFDWIFKNTFFNSFSILSIGGLSLYSIYEVITYAYAIMKGYPYDQEL